MERRINKKIEDYLIQFKNEIAKRLQNMVEGLDSSYGQGNATSDAKAKCGHLAGFVYNYEKLRLGKDDFMKRKRVKSVVPMYDRCAAKRANGELKRGRPAKSKDVVNDVNLIDMLKNMEAK